MCRRSQFSLAVSCGWFFSITVAAAQSVFPVQFGEVSARAFLVAGGGEAVSVGVAGVDLGSARLGSDNEKPSAIDPVSRLVVFEPTVGKPLALAKQVQVGQSLKVGGEVHHVESLVEQVGGRYLPFSLLRVRHDGEMPVSGTPLLDSAGCVAAVAYEPAGSGKFYAIPVEVIRRTLTAARRGNMGRSWLGLVLDPKLGIPRVVRVVPGSPAEQAGVSEGDLLVEIAGRRLTDYGDAVNAFFLLQIGEAVSLKYQRAGRLVASKLTPAQPNAAGH